MEDYQYYYNQGNSFAETVKHFKGKFSRKFLRKNLIKRKPHETLILKHSQGKYKKFNHSDETKKKCSEKRKEYLKNNPEVVENWKRSNKNHSVPCEKWKEYLTKNNISFVAEYKPLLHKERYFAIDIAFPDKKIGIEINGGFHYDENKNLKPYYQNRHDLICAEGWFLFELPYVCSYNVEIIEKIITKINSTINLSEFDYREYDHLIKMKKIKIPKVPKIPLFNYPTIEELSDLVKTNTCMELSKKFNIPYKKFHSHYNGKITFYKKTYPKKIKPSELNPNWRHESKSNCRKVKDRPSLDQLKIDIEQSGYVGTGRKYGVSDTCIKKWIRKYETGKY